MDLLGIQFSARVEASRKVRFLTEVLGPRLESLRATGAFEYWYYINSPDRDLASPFLEFLIEIIPGSQSAASGDVLKAFSDLDFSLADNSKYVQVREESFQKRVGDENGARAFHAFHHVDSILAIERLRNSTVADDVLGNLEGGLTYAFELIARFGPPVDARAICIRNWVRSCAAMTGKPKSMEYHAEQGLALYKARPELAALARMLGSVKLHPMLDQLEPFLPELELVKRNFRAALPSLPPRRPPYLVIFHSYIHLAMLRREIGIEAEMALMVLAYLSLNESGTNGAAREIA